MQNPQIEEVLDNLIQNLNLENEEQLKNYIKNFDLSIEDLKRKLKLKMNGKT